jgi:hypothetical protein
MSSLSRALCLTLAVVSSGSAAKEIVRLSPVPGPSQIPAQCRIVSVLKDSPAEKAGIAIGDVLQSINGDHPQDASGFSELVNKAPQDSEFKVLKASGVVQSLHILLNAGHPRLGAVCDLSGWAKRGVTAAGNESVTVFDGPYALTASGIIDKGIMFLRVRVANDSDRALEISPSLFAAMDGNGSTLAILSPQNVMCMLYGEKGAHLLVLKKTRRDTMDSHENNLLAPASDAEERCDDVKARGVLHSADSQYAEANAQYLATESLWPASYPPGQAADGLIYLEETNKLPVTLNAMVEGRLLLVQLGLPVASGKTMKASELRKFFEAQKKGNSIRLTLKNGTVFVGRLSSYDSDAERAWFYDPSGGLLNSTSHSLESIRSAEPLELVPSKPGPGTDHLN